MHVVTKKIIEKDLSQGPSAPKHIVTKKRSEGNSNQGPLAVYKHSFICSFS